MIFAFDFDHLQRYWTDIVITFTGLSAPNCFANCIRESVTVTEEFLLSAFFFILWKFDILDLL